ncbi:MAG: hypothetical protein ACHP6H_01900, partial [Legionellales bacterium]
TLADLTKQLSPILTHWANPTTEIHSENQPPIQSTIPKINRINTSFTFKNHHLFIKDEFVELTLNALDLKPEELQELTQLIKKILKQKGLMLHSLIINGVTQ